MDASTGGSGGFGDKKDNNNQNSNKGKSISYHFTSDQEAKLEAFFESCPHPDETQHEQLAKDLGLEPEQIKNWFQKKTKVSTPELQAPTLKPTHKQTLEETCVLNQECDINELDESDPDSSHETSNDNVNCNLMSGSEDFEDLEKARMFEIAAVAMAELLRLMSTNDVWIKPLNDMVGFVLLRHRYANLFPRVLNLVTQDIRDESSKDSQIVRIGGMQLVELILDSEEWANLFPTIVSKAETIKVFDAGSSANRSGALQLMYEEVHVLSHLVPSREFLFLRYCRQVEDGMWVIVDVSLDSFERRIPHSAPAHKLPSGCMIRELPNGSSMVTWIEHVLLLNDWMHPIRLYGDLLRDYIPFGAKRWLLALQSTCEKNICSSVEYIPSRVADREITSQEGRKSVMDLSNRMVQSFCRVLNKTSMPGFANNARMSNNPGDMQVTIRKCTGPGLPDGMVLTALASIRLPTSPQAVFHFLSDENRRHEWDILAFGNRVHEIAPISIGGTTAYNRVSFLQTFNPHENNVLILQDCCIDPLGAYVVFAPIDVATAHGIVSGDDSSMVPILPSGFMISGDGSVVVGARGSGDRRSPKGSLLTVAYQILVCASATIRDLNMETVMSVNRLFITTVQKINAALNCSDAAAPDCSDAAAPNCPNDAAPNCSDDDSDEDSDED